MELNAQERLEVGQVIELVIGPSHMVDILLRAITDKLFLFAMA